MKSRKTKINNRRDVATTLGEKRGVVYDASVFGTQKKIKFEKIAF